MASFNKTATIKTTNKEGHVAYSMRDREKLVTQVLTSFFNEKKFYGDNSKELAATAESVAKKDPDFVGRLAVYARREFNLRTVAHVLTAILAHAPEGKPYARDVVRGVCLRGDDATEILACYLNLYGKPIPNSLRRGLGDVMKGFDAYTLAKYAGEHDQVKMRDLLCLCRPKPQNAEQEKLFKQCLEGKLETPITWESQLSAHGNNRETWEKLIGSGKVGYMALLRNLRNILQAGPRNLEKVWATIEDPKRVQKSRQLPFRFLSAYKAVQDIGGSRAFEALETAIEASAANLEHLPGTTVIAVDVSGSMSDKLSAKSEVSCFETGLLLGLLANRICDNAIFYAFNDQINKENVPKNVNVLYACTRSFARGGTNMGLPFEKMLKDKVKADRIIILSDNQCNIGTGWNYYSNLQAGYTRAPVQVLADEYRRKSGNNIWVHAVDLQGYGTQQFYGQRTNVVAGWSEKVLSFILLAEQGAGTLEKTIAAYEWRDKTA